MKRINGGVGSLLVCWKKLNGGGVCVEHDHREGGRKEGEHGKLTNIRQQNSPTNVHEVKRPVEKNTVEFFVRKNINKMFESDKTK